MSRRTAASSKAIRLKWEQEQALVEEGRGTRDWTTEQQKAILEKGKAYDENGKAFEGHHMKNVEKYPDFQENPDNIQFLTRVEHREAHGGDFHIPTNGYFDPVAKVTLEFAEDALTPCPIVTLSSPLMIEGSQVKLSNESTSVNDELKSVSMDTEGSSVELKPTAQPVISQCKKQSVRPVAPKKKSFMGTVKNGAGKIGSFFKKHTGIIAGTIIVCLATVVVAEEAKRIAAENEDHDREGGIDFSNFKSNKSEGDVEENHMPTVPNEVEEDIDALGDNENDAFEPVEETEKRKRKSPERHMVNGYGRIRYGKLEKIPAHPRGGNKRDDEVESDEE